VTVVIAIILALVDPQTADLATGARALAPADLSRAAAEAHALAASSAARVYVVDPALLLAIAHHESHFELGAITAEVGGKVSCGVMTPVPQARCTPENLLASYLTGAEHLHTWMVAARGDVRTALTGYAGGYRLIKFCAAGGDARGCHVPEVFLARARQIRRYAGT
jgi:hypothetical protein